MSSLLLARGRSRRTIFLVFEGGGAKGIGHVGALRALENEEVDIRGVAGTSAGAIVAALVGAGYRSDDFLGKDGTSPLLEQLKLQRATDFLAGGWPLLRLLRATQRHKVAAHLIVALPALLVTWGLWPLEIGNAVLTFLAALQVTVCLVMYWLMRGVVRLDFLAGKLEEALAARLGLPPGTTVLFRHFDDIGCPLRIVATDLGERGLKLFSSATTPGIPVAEAVAASAALPLACHPRSIDGQVYIDGGIVSNLPAWTFDEERALDPDAVTVTVCLEPERTAKYDALGSPLGMLRSILHAAMFGRRHLETRGAPRLITMSLPTRIGTFDFDLGREKALSVVRDAENFAKAELRNVLFVLPQLFEKACEDLRRVIDGQCPIAVERRTRVLVALRDQGAIASWRIRFGSGLLPTDCDDQILLPEDASVIGACARQGVPILRAKPYDFNMAGSRNRYRNALIRRDLSWCLAIPIFADEAGSPIAVVAIDSDADVAYFDFDDEVVTTISDIAGPMFRQVLGFASKIKSFP